MHLHLITVASLSSLTHAFPAYQPLFGMTDEEISVFARYNDYVGALPPPGPLQNTSTKLVHDEGHPYIPPGPDDIRGPCPGLNTLASHGVSVLCSLSFVYTNPHPPNQYLPRSGVASPQQIVEAVQEGSRHMLFSERYPH